MDGTDLGFSQPFPFAQDPRLEIPSQGCSFSREQEAFVEHVAFRVGSVLDKRMREYVEQVVKMHRLECPAARSWMVLVACSSGLLALVVAAFEIWRAVKGG